MSIFFTPTDGACGDIIPYYNKIKKRYDIYYLHDFRDPDINKEGTPWRRFSTSNFIDFTDSYEVIPRGSHDDQDLFIYTGCVIEVAGTTHIFYTGHNYHYPSKGLRKEAVMHAVSKDGNSYVKIPEDTFFAPDLPEIEKDDWRDPFVFWNDEQNEYWMLLCTRLMNGPSRRRGATGLLTSSDLKKWDYKGSIWEPSLCWCPECPDIFQWGDYWYLIYSTFCDSEGLRTYYRIANSPEGPFVNPGNNTIDSRAFYAGKTASNGTDRYIFGWNPSKLGNTDNGTWQWGGSMIVHKLNQNSDGTLDVSMPDSYDKLFDASVPLEFRDTIGETDIESGIIKLSCTDNFSAIRINDLFDKCLISFNIKLHEGTDGAGIMFGASEDLNDGYYIRLEPSRGKFVFDSANRICEHPEIERYTNIEVNRTHSISVIIDGTIISAYLDCKVALSARMYQPHGKSAALFSYDGAAEFTDVTIRYYKESFDES